MASKARTVLRGDGYRWLEIELAEGVFLQGEIEFAEIKINDSVGSIAGISTFQTLRMGRVRASNLSLCR